MHYLLLLFIPTALAEIYLLFYTSSTIGILNTMLIMLITAITGTTVLRLNGFFTLNKIKQQLSQGTIPAIPLLEGFIVCIASILLITPGLCSDTIGILCLIPPLRTHFAQAILAKISPISPISPFPTAEKTTGSTIEGSFVEHPSENKRLR